MESLYMDDMGAPDFPPVPLRSCSAVRDPFAIARARPAEPAPNAPPANAAPSTSPPSMRSLLPDATSKPCFASVSTVPVAAPVAAAAATKAGVASPPVARVKPMPAALVPRLMKALGTTIGSEISCTYSSVQRRLADSVSPPPMTSPSDLPHFDNSLNTGTSLSKPPLAKHRRVVLVKPSLVVGEIPQKELCLVKGRPGVP
mmetsp:Transcript_124239/g.397430  ORF Transcript_124239/g.397430 Transcript_124239/m.397430 type:complete len:201 (+) Transcript_124239:704-1306(+)